MESLLSPVPPTSSATINTCDEGKKDEIDPIVFVSARIEIQNCEWNQRLNYLEVLTTYLKEQSLNLETVIISNHPFAGCTYCFHCDEKTQFRMRKFKCTSKRLHGLSIYVNKDMELQGCGPKDFITVQIDLFVSLLASHFPNNFVNLTNMKYFQKFPGVRRIGSPCPFCGAFRWSEAKKKSSVREKKKREKKTI